MSTPKLGQLPPNAIDSNRSPGALGAILKPALRVYFASLENSLDTMECAYNPRVISTRRSVNRGSLTPVGNSHPVKMYGATGSLDFPSSVRIEYSALKLAELGYRDPMEPIRWFDSHTVPAAPGRSPDPVIFVWPNYFVFVCIVLSVTTEVQQFNRYMVPTNYIITLGLEEIRDSFYSSGDARKGKYLGGGRFADPLGKRRGAPKLLVGGIGIDRRPWR